MSDELEWVRSLRPTVDGPSRDSREQALLRLERAIAADPAGASAPPVGARAERRTATRGHASTLDGVRGSDGGGRVRPRGRSRLPGLGGVVSSLAVLVALVIAGGALVLPHHAHTGSGSTVAVAAARGEILDRDGNVLVGDKPEYEIQINPAALPSAAAARATEYRLLEHVLGFSDVPAQCTMTGGVVLQLAAIECLVAQHAKVAAAATVVTDVSPRVAAAVSQDKAELAGVSVKRGSVRRYPYGSLAAQVFGAVGPITGAQLHNAGYEGVPRTANRRAVRARVQLRQRPARGGQPQNLAQRRAADDRRGGAGASDRQNPPATGGAFVAMNPQNGEIYAMGSAPTFNPTSVITSPAQ